MPRFRVRLDDPNSDEFRVVFVTADSKPAARARCEQLEQGYVAFAIPDEDLLAELERKEADGELTHPGREFGLLHQHRQTEPYEVTSVELRGERKSKTKAQRKKRGR